MFEKFLLKNLLLLLSSKVENNFHFDFKEFDNYELIHVFMEH